MKRLILMMLLVLTTQVRAEEPKLSEKFSIEIGEAYSETDGWFKEFYKYKDYVVAVNRHKDDLVVQKIDPKTLKEVERIVHEKYFKNDKITGSFHNLKRVGDNIFVFFIKKNKKAKAWQIIAQSISLETLNLGDLKTVINQSLKKEIWGLKYRLSFDENILMISFWEKPEIKNDKKNKRTISVNVFDVNCDLVWNTIINVPYFESRIRTKDFAVDNNGNIFLISKVFDDDSLDEVSKKKKMHDKDIPNYHMELFKILKDTKTLGIKKIDTKGMFIDDISIHEGIGGDMIVAGTARNDGRYGKPTSLFFAKLSADGIFGDVKFYEFPLEMLKQYADKHQKKALKKEEKKDDLTPSFDDLEIHTIVHNSDGSFVIIGEEYARITITRTKSDGSVYTFTYRTYRNLMATKINADGKLVWMKKLPKNQRGEDRKGTMSFTHMFAGDYHYLLYLDNIKNLELEEDEVPAIHSDGHGGYFTAYIIDDKSGTVQKEAIFNVRNIDGKDKGLGNFSTDKILPLSDSEILIEGYAGKKKDFLVKVSAKK